MQLARTIPTTAIPGRIALLALAAGALALPALAQPGDSLADTACFKTAVAARTAARYEARSDFWNGVGQSLNFSDPVESLEVLEEALDELKDAMGLIDEQYQARIDLCVALGEDLYDPDLDPDDFSSKVTHPYFPLKVGVTRIYAGVTAEGRERVVETTLDETREIMGIECAVVHARAYLEDELIEDTFDYYAQDEDGNVWYMGEMSFELEDGYIVNMAGSWIAGEDGAKAGIIMPAAPTPGMIYRQEWLLNEAEDIGEFLAAGQTVSVPLAGGTTFTDCWVTEDTSPIEPTALEHKTYAPRVGLVYEVSVASGEHIDLVEIITE